MTHNITFFTFFGWLFKLGGLILCFINSRQENTFTDGIQYYIPFDDCITTDYYMLFQAIRIVYNDNGEPMTLDVFGKCWLKVFSTL